MTSADDTRTEHSFTPQAMRAEVLSFEDARTQRDKPTPPAWALLSTFVDEIELHKNDPWVSLKLLDDEIVKVRAGALVPLNGGPGGGKSSLAANLLLEHATNSGPAIACSIELPGMEFTARAIGIKCDESWVGVLTGQVSRDEMLRVTALERFAVLQRKQATLANLRACVQALREQFPAQPILAAVDYVQLMESGQEKQKGQEERIRVADTVAALDELAREFGLVILALSQMGRAGAKSARDGSSVGYDASELSAETSAFERFATTTLTIGKKSEPFEDGSRVVELSVGKFRMGEGDRVLPMREWGRSGKWRVEGPAKTATEVRDSRETDAAAAQTRSLENQLIGALTASSAPLSKNQLVDLVVGRMTGGKPRKLAVVNALIASGTFVEVARRAPRAPAGTWMIWTPSRAREAGVQTVEEFHSGNGGDS